MSGIDFSRVGPCVVCNRFGGYAHLCRDCMPFSRPCSSGMCAPLPGQDCCLVEAIYEDAARFARRAGR